MRRLAAYATPSAVLVVTCLLAGAFKLHCGAVWTGAIQYTTGCYSDAVPFWGLRGVAAGELPYFQTRLEYPVLTGALIWLEGLATRLLWGTRADAQGFLAVVTAVNALLAFWVLDMMERAGAPRWRQYAWAAGPPLVLYLGHNWDMLAIALAAAAFLAAARRQERRATALAAFGTAAKLFPVLLLPLLGLAALFRRGKGWRARFVTAAALVAVAMLAWGAVNLPVALAAPENWSEFYTFSKDRAGTAASIWEIAGAQGWTLLAQADRNLWSFLLFAAGAAAIVAIGWRRHQGHLWFLFPAVLAWFLLTNKVWSPQFDLWLWPFLVLTVRRPWLLAWFAVADIACYFGEFWWFARLEGAWFGTTPTHIALAAALRAGALFWVIAEALLRQPPNWMLQSNRTSENAAALPR